VRRDVATNRKTPPDVFQLLRCDPDERVRGVLQGRHIEWAVPFPGCSGEER
jgi:hypothetical protein